MPNRKEPPFLLQDALLFLCEWCREPLQPLQGVANLVLLCGNDPRLVGPPEWKVEQKKSHKKFLLIAVCRNKFETLSQSPAANRIYPPLTKCRLEEGRPILFGFLDQREEGRLPPKESESVYWQD